MRPILHLLFWSSAGLLLYAHAAFPALIRLLAIRRRRVVVRGEALPTVSLIVCAANEEKHIREKIEDSLRLDYPPDRLEILVISDGSTDGTNAILAAMAGPRVRAHVLPERGGKARAQNVAAGLARHEVLFFTDATTMHPPGTLRALVRNLADPAVGCVSGRPVFRGAGEVVSRAHDARFTLEMGTRSALSDIYSLLGAQDCVYVVPRTLYRPVNEDLDSGFVGPLLVLEAGHRTAYEPEALAYVDRPAPELRTEFARRSRIVLRGLRGLLHLRRLLNPFRHGFLALALISSRLLRWLTPVFLLAMLGTNLLLLDRPLYRLTLALQATFYAAALGGLWRARAGRPAPAVLSLPFYFCLLAAAAGAGIVRLLRGETGQVWHTRR